MQTMTNYDETQSNSSHDSRGTKFGDRVVDSVNRYHKYFIPAKPVLDIGCNDGLAMEAIIKRGFEVKGVDISVMRVAKCVGRGLDVVYGRQERLPYGNKEFGTIFASHVLEHSNNIEDSLKEFGRVAERAIIIVPIEKTSKNPAHFSVIRQPEDLRQQINEYWGYDILYEELLYRMESEYVVIVDFSI